MKCGIAAAWPLLKPDIMAGCPPTSARPPAGFCTLEKTGAWPPPYCRGRRCWYWYGDCAGLLDGIDGMEPCDTAGDIRCMDPPALMGLCCWLSVGDGPVE